ncbi:energy transducer TonB [Methylovorus glucosotrophus]|uniref:energy transducer TonB n=1 Tax=Methylovorus glucosotrophus TaxID=266009 RepID=UPI001EE66A6C|nr:energy transducer TonB [Methylovorus glucosotrophus]
MNLATYSPSISVPSYRLQWALIISIAVHAILIWQLPNLKFDSPPEPQVLQIELATPVKKQEETPAEAPAPAPEPPKPEPVVKPEVKPQPKPVIKPSPEVAPPPVERKPDPSPPVMTTTPQPEAPKAETAPAPAPVAAAQPAPAAPAEPPKVAATSQQDLDAAKNEFGNSVFNVLAKYKKYPNIARRNNMQGTPVLELELDAQGHIINGRIKQSGGYEVLDRQVLDMYRQALSSLPIAPSTLQGKITTLSIPISFRLEER